MAKTSGCASSPGNAGASADAGAAALCRAVDLHTGLLILPQTDRREAQWPLLDAALIYIAGQAEAANESAADWMLNKRVEVDSGGAATHEDLPAG